MQSFCLLEHASRLEENFDMTVLYLDFDGVLHDSEVWFNPKRGAYIDTSGRSLFEWAPILEQLLEPHPDISIILSTSWVRVRSFNRAKYSLPTPLRDRIIGATFNRGTMQSEDFELLTRAEQILRDVRRRRPQSWFAIDDDDLGWPDMY